MGGSICYLFEGLALNDNVDPRADFYPTFLFVAVAAAFILEALAPVFDSLVFPGVFSDELEIVMTVF